MREPVIIGTCYVSTAASHTAADKDHHPMKESPPRLRLLSGVGALLAILLGLSGCSGTEKEASTPEGAENEPVALQMQRQLRPPFLDALGTGELFYDINDFQPPPEEDRKPYPVKTILITGRTESSISLRWHDRSSVETSTLLRRRADGSSGWEEAHTYGPVTGFNDVTDQGLDPDRRYCYQFVVSNEHGDSFSPQRCAYTRGATVLPIYRAQLQVETADITNAGTNDRVSVRLNSVPGALTVPTGNVTVMDYGQNDFGSGDNFFYDLELTTLENFTDVTLLSVSKDGDNGLCISAMALWLNNVRVFHEDFGSRPDGCHWLDNSGDHSRRYSVFHDTLRAHPDWQQFGPTVQFAIDRDEIESRMEGMAGHLFSSIDQAQWGNRHGRAWVEASHRDSDTVQVNLDMEGEASYWLNPDIDIDFAVSFRFSERNGQWEFDITTSNLEATADFDWFTETLSFILPCGPVISIAFDEGIPDCITYLEGYIEDRVRDAWQPIAESFAINNPCPADTRPMATVTLTPDIEFSCVEEEGIGPPPVLVIEGGAVVLAPID
jgi:hypothetical protein